MEEQQANEQQANEQQAIEQQNEVSTEELGQRMEDAGFGPGYRYSALGLVTVV